MKKHKDHLLPLYLYSHRKSIVLFSLFILCFTVVFFLSHLPLDSIFYGALLCFYIIVIFVTIDFFKFAKHHKNLTECQSTIMVQLSSLPTPRTSVERQYQELLDILDTNRRDATALGDRKQMEMVDYFTQWTHQIKTPIAAMRLLLQAEPNEQPAKLELELLKIEQYVEFVLQYLRLDHLSNDLELRKYDIADIVKQAIRKNAKIFIRKKIKLHYSEESLFVITDKKWLLFVIEQIISNALKYTNEGSISIYLDRYRLVIHDTGIGIRQEDLPRVFERGFTGYNGRIINQSTGIGLYLCKQIVTKLSHQIEIDSVVGQGTKVMINLETKDIGVE